MNPCTWGELGHAKVMLLHTYKIKAKIQHSLDFIDLDYKCTYYYTITNTHISLGKRAPKLRFHGHAYTVFTSPHPQIPNQNKHIISIITLIVGACQRIMGGKTQNIYICGAKC
jgi:hypothetical protein